MRQFRTRRAVTPRPAAGAGQWDTCTRGRAAFTAARVPWVRGAAPAQPRPFPPHLPPAAFFSGAAAAWLRPPPGSSGPCRAVPGGRSCCPAPGALGGGAGQALPEPPPPGPGHTRRCGARARPHHCPAATGAPGQPRVRLRTVQGARQRRRYRPAKPPKRSGLPAGSRFSAPLSACDSLLNRVTHYRTRQMS